MNETLSRCPACDGDEVVDRAMQWVPAHLLPQPATVSQELQARIMAGLNIVSPKEIPTSNDGWDAHYNPDPQANRARIRALLAAQDLAMEEAEIGGVHCYLITPKNHPAGHHPIFVNFHGGGYVGGAGEAGLNEALYFASISRQQVMAVDYRMPPDHPYPAAVDDAFAVWREITTSTPPSRIGLFGTSAGGAIILCLVQRLVGTGKAVPEAIICGTPWSDLSETGDSYFVNRYADPVKYEGSLQIKANQYANGLDLKDARISPIYGPFRGFPPTLLISGTRDLFLSNTVRVDRKLRDAGCASHLIVYEGQSHGRYLSGLDVPETRVACQDMTDFFVRHLN